MRAQRNLAGNLNVILAYLQVKFMKMLDLFGNMSR